MRTELKVLRVKNKLTQKELADKLGVSYPTYNLIEQGKRVGSTGFWLDLQSLFKLDDGELWKIYKTNE